MEKLESTKTKFKVYAPDDLAKRWYVEWYDKGKRMKRAGSINRGETIEQRWKLADKLICELQKLYPFQSSALEGEIFNAIDDNKQHWRKSTYTQYLTVANALSDFLGGAMITEESIRLFFKEVKKTRHATTYNCYRGCLRKVLNDLGKEGIIENVPRLKTVKTPAKYFRPGYAKRLKHLIVKEAPSLSLFIDFIYFCFLRPKEIRYLRVDDIILEEQLIRIPGEVSKNKKTEFITIPDPLLPKLDFIKEMSPNDLLFPNYRDASKPLGKGYMYRFHKKFLERLCFGKGYTLYSWKHTGAVAVAKKGVSLKQLQIQLRHYSLDQTDQYLRQMGVQDLGELQRDFPVVWE
ncbi:MAG: site-specific integrase [Cyanobacteria bacterium J06649_11]